MPENLLKVGENSAHEVPVVLVRPDGSTVEGSLAFRAYRHDPRPLDPERGERVAGQPWVSDGRVAVAYSLTGQAKVYRRSIVLSDGAMRAGLRAGGGALRIGPGEVETFRDAAANILGFIDEVPVPPERLADEVNHDPDYASAPPAAVRDQWGPLVELEDPADPAPGEGEVGKAPRPDPGLWLAVGGDWRWHRAKVVAKPSSVGEFQADPPAFFTACGFRIKKSEPVAERRVDDVAELPGFVAGAPFGFCYDCLEAKSVGLPKEIEPLGETPSTCALEIRAGWDAYVELRAARRLVGEGKLKDAVKALAPAAAGHAKDCPYRIAFVTLGEELAALNGPTARVFARLRGSLISARSNGYRRGRRVEESAAELLDAAMTMIVPELCPKAAYARRRDPALRFAPSNAPASPPGVVDGYSWPR